MHKQYMRIALELAKKGGRQVHPNPLVGAVLVKNGTVIGQGFHAVYGGPHAEVVAISNAKEAGHIDFSDTILYVTLEPCCHYGKTPPCTSLILQSGIPQVVIGMEDPNPLVAGKGITILRKAGVAVSVGVLQNECQELNRVFRTYIATGKPYVLLKAGISLDGKIATTTGDSRWITSEASRRDAHRLRGEYMAIMCGIGTVLADDPQLTVRMVTGTHPTRVIVDSRLRIPLSSTIVQTAKEIPTIIATTSESDPIKSAQLESMGVTVLYTPPDKSRVNLEALLTALGRKGIDSLLLEGGATLAFSALKAGLVHAIRLYMAPFLIGGDTAKGLLAGDGFGTLKEACRIENVRVTTCGPDMVVEGYPCLPA